MKNQKGVSPLIATVLLLLVCMAVGVIIWQWVMSMQSSVQTESEQERQRMTRCSGVSLGIDLTDTKPVWNSTTKNTTVVVQNKGSRDLNGFKLIAYYSGGNSDTNTYADTTIAAGAQTVLTVGGTANGASKPLRVRVESTQCNISTEVNQTDITG